MSRQNLMYQTDFYDAKELIAAIQKLPNLDSQDVILCFDAQGEPVQQFKLIEVELSDGSWVYNLVLGNKQ